MENVTSADPVTENLAQVIIGQPTAEEILTNGVQTTETKAVEQKAEWFSSFKDELLQKDPSVQKFKSAEDLAKSYVNLQKAFGADKVKVPNDKSSQEEWDAYYSKIGMPESADKYSLKDAPEGSLIGKKDFAEFARGLRLTDKQATGLQDWFNGQVENKYNQAQQMQEAQVKESEATLRKELGEKYDASLLGARKVIDLFTNETERDNIVNRYGNDPAFIKMLAGISEHVSEDSLGAVGKIRHSMTPKEADAAYTDILMNKQDPAHNPSHPMYQERNDYLVRLAGIMLQGK